MYSSQSTALLVVSTVLSLLASAAVGVRLLVRRKVKAGIRADDIFIVSALVCSHALKVPNV